MSKTNRSRRPNHPPPRSVACLLGLVVIIGSLAGCEGCEGCGDKKPKKKKEVKLDVAPQEPDGDPLEEAKEQAEEEAVSIAVRTNENARYISGNIEAKNRPDDPEPRVPQKTPGSVDTAALQKVFSQHDGAMQDCYERALKKNPNLAGRVTLTITISRSGGVAAATATPGSLSSAQVNECLERQALRWKFPPPTGGAAKVRKPYTFSPKN